MAKCDICAKGGSCRFINGVNFCESCFSELQKIRNQDIAKIEYYSDSSNYSNATENGKKYMIEQAKIYAEKVELFVETSKDNARIQEKYENMILTSTNSIEGFKISKYLGMVCGEIVIPNGLLGAITQGTYFTISALDKAREEAFISVRQKAANLEADAIVAIDIDINTLNGGVMVSVHGTAVNIEPIIPDIE